MRTVVTAVWSTGSAAASAITLSCVTVGFVGGLFFISLNALRDRHHLWGRGVLVLLS